jgi:hypothetical protein
LKAAEAGDVQRVVDILKKANLNINFRHPKTRQTALSFAVLKSHVECVKVLLEQGADPFLEDINGAAPKDICMEETSGIDPKIITMFKQHDMVSSLFSAVECNDYQEVKRYEHYSRQNHDTFQANFTWCSIR